MPDLDLDELLKNIENQFDLGLTNAVDPALLIGIKPEGTQNIIHPYKHRDNIIHNIVGHIYG